MHEAPAPPTSPSESETYIGRFRTSYRQHAQRCAQIFSISQYCDGPFLLLSCCFFFALSGCGNYVVSGGDTVTIVASPNTVAFGNVSVGQAASARVSLLNASSASVQVTQLNLSGQAFSVSGQVNLPVTIAAGGTYSLDLQFDPAITGTATGKMTIISDASPTSKAVVSLSGMGTAGTQPPLATLSALSCSVPTAGTGTDACTVTLTTPAPSAGLSVSLSSNNAAVTVPGSVTVPANVTSAGFTASVSSVASPDAVTLTASEGSVSKTFTLELTVASSVLGVNAATIDWTSVRQVIDGFGGSDAFSGSSMSSANQAFFFGTGSGQLGLSLLRVAVPDNGGIAGNCANVSTSCAGPDVSDMQAVIANGGRIYASPWSPPGAYKTNGSVDCTAGPGNGSLVTTDYALYAIWLANFVQSLRTEYGITPYAISVQNEPEGCHSYDSALWSAANIDTFVKTNLGPTFASEALSTLIFVPEGGHYFDSKSLGAACGMDSSCTQYVGGYNWHDYDASLSGSNTVAGDPYPSGWPEGKKYWETEASCGAGFGPNFCQSGFNTNIMDALGWAAVIDQRLAVDGANAWLYWWLVDEGNQDDQGLIASDGTIAQRAYMLGQYSKFVRPGYSRIDATHLPQTGVSVSAYQETGTESLVIIATNYTGSAMSQSFSLANAPTFSTLTPTITSENLNLAKQSNVSVSGNSFIYTLPAESITTFVGSSSTPPDQ